MAVVTVALLTGVAVLSNVVAPTAAYAADPEPIITVGPQTDEVWGDHWDQYVDITVTIGSANWATSADETGNWYIALGSFDVQADDLVSATDGTTTKDHTVFDFEITAISDAANTVIGTTDAGTTDLDQDLRGTDSRIGHVHPLDPAIRSEHGGLHHDQSLF
jgi:hypothetical protein